MAKMTMFLTNMPAKPAAPPTPDLGQLVARLPQPLHQLQGRSAKSLVLPDNIVCFQRRTAADLNKPRRGRALHHRFVLICALRTTVTVCVDDRSIRLKSGEALLVFPFQFHHYAEARQRDLSWLFVTFELAGPEALAALRYQPLRLTPPLLALVAELVAAYEAERTADLSVLLLALVLERLRRLRPVAPEAEAQAAPQPGLMLRVNQLAQRPGESLGLGEIARSLGISPSHLRARFRASCGVSIGRHLRQLRLEQACGLLRLGPQRVSEIAEQCGFSSIYSFSRAFRSAYGVSPLAYRHSGRAAPASRRAVRRPVRGGTR